ncbi:hypothetical protein J6X13_03260 [Candidatus Saccharibacteria bacterium]|nr:hypothetical protein [Candidatus Saccharibacteria bacterium]
MKFTPITFEGLMKIHALGAESITMRPIDPEDLYLGYTIKFPNGFWLWAEKQKNFLGCRKSDLFSVRILYCGKEWYGKLVEGRGYEYELIPEYYTEEGFIELCEKFSLRTDKPEGGELEET